MLTLDDLREFMRGCGVDDATDLDGDIEDSAFGDLGYDSLALLEITAQIEQRYGVKLPDDRLDDIKTPGQMLSFVNSEMIGA